MLTRASLRWLGDVPFRAKHGVTKFCAKVVKAIKSFHHCWQRNEKPAGVNRSIAFCLPLLGFPRLISKDAVGTPLPRITVDTHASPQKNSRKPYDWASGGISGHK